MVAKAGNCEAWRAVAGDFECCISCHWEWDDGYGEPLERWYDGKQFFVCCAAPEVEGMSLWPPKESKS